MAGLRVKVFVLDLAPTRFTLRRAPPRCRLVRPATPVDPPAPYRLTGEVRRRPVARRPGGLGRPQSRIRARTPADRLQAPAQAQARVQAPAGPSGWHGRELARLTASSERPLTQMTRRHRSLRPFVRRDPAARRSLVRLFSALLGAAQSDSVRPASGRRCSLGHVVEEIHAQKEANGENRPTERGSPSPGAGNPQNVAEAGAKRGRWRPGFAPGPGYFPALSSRSNSFDPCRSSSSNALDPITERSVESSRCSSAPRCASPARATACSSRRAEASTPPMPSKRSVSRPPEASNRLARSLPAGALAGPPADAPPGTPAARSASCRATRRTVARKSSRLEGKLA